MNMSHTNGGTNGATMGKRERRTILESDVALLKQLQDYLGPNQTAIPFSSLSTEQKLALIPSASPRLVRFKLVNIEYDPDTFAPTNVTINDEMVKAYEKDINAPVREHIVTKKEPKSKARTNVLATLYIAKIDPPKKPRNPGTEAGYNYDLYNNGMTVAEYIDATYDRNLKTRQGKWFNGPSFQLLYSDMDAGNIWVHDADGNAKSKKEVMPRGERNVDFSPDSDSVTGSEPAPH